MKMRKVLSALLVAACTLSLAACGSSSSKNETTGASGETAAGKYPVKAVEVMAKIAERTEQSIHYDKRFRNFDFQIRNTA